MDSTTHIVPFCRGDEVGRRARRHGRELQTDARVPAADLRVAGSTNQGGCRPGRARARRASRPVRSGSSARRRACLDRSAPVLESVEYSRSADSHDPGRVPGVPFVERVGLGGGGQREQDEAREHGEETAHPPTLLAAQRPGKGRSVSSTGPRRSRSGSPRAAAGGVTTRWAPLPITSARYTRPCTPGKRRVGPRPQTRRCGLRRRARRSALAREPVPAAQLEPPRAARTRDREARQRRAVHVAAPVAGGLRGLRRRARAPAAPRRRREARRAAPMAAPPTSVRGLHRDVVAHLSI